MIELNGLGLDLCETEEFHEILAWLTILPSQLLRCSCCHAYVNQSPSSTQFCSPLGMDCILPNALKVSPLPAGLVAAAPAQVYTSLTWPLSQSAVGSQVVHGQHRAGSHFQRKAGLKLMRHGRHGHLVSEPGIYAGVHRSALECPMVLLEA